MGRSQDCGMSPYVNSPQNYLASANASEPAGSVLHRSAWKDAVLVGNFLATVDWQAIEVESWTKADLDADITGLRSKMQEHLDEEAMMNIHGEATDFTPRFENVCLYDGHSHPETYRLTQTVSQIGWYSVQYFKDREKRNRPSKDYPLIFRPLIKVPSHPSYPSGHATQSKLVGDLLIDLIGTKDGEPLHDRIKDVYDDIAINRERAGVHYPSDTAAGQALAEQLYKKIGNEQRLKAAIIKAKSEWTS